MSQPGSLCVDIDVSKAILDIAASSAIEQFSVGNDSDGFDAIIAELRMYAIALVLMKATGGLETAIVCALQAEGFELAVVNPRQARDLPAPWDTSRKLIVLMPECFPRWLRFSTGIRSGNALSEHCRILNVRFSLQW